MQFNQSQASTLEKAIINWEQQQLISPETAQQLRNSYTIRRFDWKALARYAFVIAILCGVIAVVAIFADKKLIRFLETLIDKVFNAPNIILALLCGSIAAIFFYFGDKKKHENPDRIFTNEGFVLMGIAFTAFTSANLAGLTGSGNVYYVSVFLIAAVLYFLLSSLFKNALIWLFALIAVSCLFVAVSGVLVNWRPYFLGMNLPLRLTIFSILLLTACYLTKNTKMLRPFYSFSFFYCLLLFFTSLWITSIFGNQSNWESWGNIRQIHLWPWALLSTAASALAVYIGWKKDIYALRSFGIVFIFINIYTRYFEYCWNGSYKALFFIVLALSFWFIGRSAEKIWNADFMKKK